MTKELILKRARLGFCVLLALSYIFALYAVVHTHLVPDKYLIPVVPATAIIIFLLVLASLKKQLSVGKSIALIVVSFLLIAANVYVFANSTATTSFLNNIQDDGYSYEEYSVIAKKDRHISLSSAQLVGYIHTDENKDLVLPILKEKTPARQMPYTSLTDTTNAVDTSAIDTAAINSSYLQLLQENDPTFYQSVEVLGTFKIKIKKDSNTVKTDVTKPFVLYISGIDTYGAVATVSRSDVNILAVVNPETHKVLLVTTPRDYYVQLHGTTGLKDKLTHAGIYGIDESVSTMEDLYNTQINYYLRINFSSLVNIVDTLGGVDVNSAYNFTADGNTFVQGMNHLNGKQALAFSRDRHSFTEGDRTRGENQERVIEAIINKMNSPNTLVNYTQILSSLQGAFQTNMSTDDMTKLIRSQLNDVRKWSVTSTSVTGSDSHNYTYSISNILLYVMLPDQASLNAAKQQIQQFEQ